MANKIMKMYFLITNGQIKMNENIFPIKLEVVKNMKIGMGTIRRKKLLQSIKGQFGTMKILNDKTLDPFILF